MFLEKISCKKIISHTYELSFLLIVEYFEKLCNFTYKR